MSQSIRPYRPDGRASCPPLPKLPLSSTRGAARSHSVTPSVRHEEEEYSWNHEAAPTATVSRSNSDSFDRLTQSLRVVTDKVIALEAAQGRPAFSALNKMADYIERFNLDDGAKAVAANVTEMVQESVERLSSGGGINAAVTTCSMTVLDQLLALLVQREPMVKDAVDLAREGLIRSVYINPDLRELPKPMRCRDAKVEEALREPYQDGRAFYTATQALTAKLRRTEQQLHRAQRGLERFNVAFTFYNRIIERMILEKAMKGWSMIARRRRNRIEKDYIDKDRINQTEALRNRVRELEETCKHVQRNADARAGLLEKELFTTQKSYDAFLVIAEKAKAERDEVKSKLVHTETTVMKQFKRKLKELNSVRSKWKGLFTDMRNSGALVVFEDKNRERVANLLSQPPSEALLVQWSEALVSPLRDIGQKCKFGVFMGQEVLPSYVGLLHAMSPGHVPGSVVEDAFRASTAAQQVEILDQSLQALGIVYPLPCRVLLAGNPADHYMFLSQCFTRFCGVGAVLAFQPPKNSPDRLSWEPAMPIHEQHGGGNRLAIMDSANMMGASVRGGSQDLMGASMNPGASVNPGAASTNAPTPEFSVENMANEVAVAERTMAEQSDSMKKWQGLSTIVNKVTVKMALDEAKAQGARRRSGVSPSEIPLSIREKSMMEPFTVVNVPRAVAAFNVSEEEIEALRTTVLLPSSRKLRRVYLFYAAGGQFKVDKDPSMSQEEFLRLVTDSHLLSRTFKTSAVHAVFSASQLPGELSDNKMAPGEFVEAILRLAWAQNSVSPSQTLEEESLAMALSDDAGMDVSVRPDGGGGDTLLDKVRFVLEQKIFKYASGVAAEEFMRQASAPQVVEVLTDCKNALRRVFKVYSTMEDGLLGPTGEGGDMNDKEFVRMMTDAKVIDEVCTHFALQQVYAKVMDNDSASAGVAGPTGRTGLRYNTFLDALVCVAAFKNPSPFVSLASKVRRFMDLTIIPLSQHAKKR